MVIDANAEYVRLTGRTDLQEILGRSVLEWTAKHEIERNSQAVAQCTRDGFIRNLEIDYADRNGRTTPIEINATVHGEGESLQIISLCRDITERKQMEDRILKLAFQDPLTQLPNRRLLMDRLIQAMAANKRSGCYGAILFLDLDNFKPLNDAHGHDFGDLLLIEVADRLNTCVREMDTVARFGGDEFVVMLSELDAVRVESMAQARHVAEKIRISLAEPYRLTIRHEGMMDSIVIHRCTVSIGVALFINNEASLEEVFKCADEAMYRAKESGRNSVQFYEPII
jgi:diguanylate cyclase (GGDEF)-like protein/PAS domain S-box-containing protein